LPDCYYFVATAYHLHSPPASTAFTIAFRLFTDYLISPLPPDFRLIDAFHFVNYSLRL